MSKVIADITMSLDGYVAPPSADSQDGVGSVDELQAWVMEQDPVDTEILERATAAVPETPIIGAEIVESGTVGNGTGAFTGFEGTIEMRFTFDGDAQPVGTYTVTLQRTG